MSRTLALIVFSCLISLSATGRAQTGGLNVPFHEGLCPRLGETGFGFVDYKGEWVIPATLPGVSPFSNGIAEVDGPAPDGRPGPYYIDFTGKPVDDTLVRRIQAGLRKVQKDGKWGFADPDSGEIVIEPKYDEVWDFSEGLALVRVESTSSARCRWIDYAGVDRIVLPSLTDAQPFHDGLAKVQTEVLGTEDVPTRSKWGLIDRTGNFVVRPVYDDIADFKDGRARVCVEEMHGFIDLTGTVVVPAKYSGAMDYSEGLAAVMVVANPKAQWGYIDLTGRLVIPADYWRVKSFSHGMAYVMGRQFQGFIDHSGNLLWEAKIEIVVGF